MRSADTAIHISLLVVNFRVPLAPFQRLLVTLRAHNRRDLTVRHIRSPI
jgi:hypothetical protein